MGLKQSKESAISWDGKVVLITGAARGIGAEVAKQLIARGAAVALVDRDAEGVQRCAATLGEAAVPIVADITDEASLAAAVQRTVDVLGGIDVVVANAGIVGIAETVDRMELQPSRQIIDVDLFGAIATVHAALPHVIDRRGYVLVVSSIAAGLPMATTSAYNAAKAGVETFARSVDMEVGHTGTQVGVAYFGFVDTDMSRDVGEQPLGIAMTKLFPKRLATPISPATAAAAIVRGIEHRSISVYAPGWIRAVLFLRPFNGLIVRRFSHHRGLIAALQASRDVAAVPLRDEVTGTAIPLPTREDVVR